MTNFFREVSNGDNYGEVQPLIVYSLQDKQGMTLSMSDVVDSAAKTNLQGLELGHSVSCFLKLRDRAMQLQFRLFDRARSHWY